MNPEFETYCQALVGKGNGRDWVRRNRSVLERRFADNPVPFDPPLEPIKRHDRYDEL
jgi:hypothetical protein